VDDEYMIIQLIRQLGHWDVLDIEIIDECQTGEAALQSILKNQPDLVLSDIKMPGYDGIELIEKGFSMLIFPEGTRSKGPEMADFKRGALKLATKPGVPVVPVSLHGTYRVFEETGIIKGTRIDIMIHPPMETKDLSKPQEKQFVVELENIVRDGLEQLKKIQEEANA